MFSHRIKLIVILLLLLFIGRPPVYSAEQDFAKVQIQTEKAAGNVFMLIGAGGNIGVSSGDDGVLMIDTSYAAMTNKIKAAIGAISDKPIRFVIITHWHRDHVGGNENFAKTGAILVAHENVRQRLTSEQYVEFFKTTIPPLPESALPIITFKQDVTFHLSGDDISIFHIKKAHTDGDSVIYFKKSNVIHMGDIFFNGMYPYIDLSVGGSINGMIRAVKQVLMLCDGDTKVIPGHGPLSDKAGLERYLNMLMTVRDRIAREIEAGKTLDAVIASKPTLDFDQSLGKGFLKNEQFVRIVYDSLKKEGKE